MTVRQLIAQLNKMPATARVFLSDHDHEEGETNGPASRVSLLKSEDAGPAEDWRHDEQHVVVISL